MMDGWVRDEWIDGRAVAWVVGGWLDGCRSAQKGGGNLWYRKVFTKIFIEDEFLRAVIQWKDRLQVRR